MISAGFAREYDGEDLLREPFHIFIPLAASFVASLFVGSTDVSKDTKVTDDVIQ